jgi:hypothetical protein
MLDRVHPPPAAFRARRQRARQRNGVRWELRLKLPTDRLAKALAAATPSAGDLDTKEGLEAELQSVVLAFVERWISVRPGKTFVQLQKSFPKNDPEYREGLALRAF